LGFAIGRLRAHVREYTRAFAAYRAGNEAHREIVDRIVGPYDREGRERQAERLRQLYTREAVAALAGAGTDTERPLFVIGMTRSGTTLVEQILSRHPAVFAAGERPVLAQVRDRFERVAIGGNGRL